MPNPAQPNEQYLSFVVHHTCPAKSFAANTDLTRDARISHHLLCLSTIYEIFLIIPQLRQPSDDY